MSEKSAVEENVVVICEICKRKPSKIVIKPRYWKRPMGVCSGCHTKVRRFFCKYCDIRVVSKTDTSPWHGSSFHRDDCPRAVKETTDE